MKRIRPILLFLSFLYITLYIPVCLATYCPPWYTLNCRFHGRCARVGEDKARLGIDELTSYYRHTGSSLDSPFWTYKEKKHLTEVRSIFDGLFVFGLLSIVIFGVCFSSDQLKRFSLINTGIIMMLILILPFFAQFWRHIFHPLLFNNMNWLNTPNDFSYYILPRVFFKHTLIFVVLTAVATNISVFGLFYARDVRRLKK